MRQRGWREGASRVAAMVLLLAVACSPTRPAPGAPQASSDAAAAPGSQTVATQPPKTLNIGLTEEPRNGIALFGGGGLPGGQYAFTFHSGLTVYDDQGTILPRIAQKVPSVTDGDWIVRPDGTMQETWKLRPDVKWHDGEPLTADDFVFGVQLLNDKELPLARTRGQAFIAGATAPDPQTLVVEWKSIYVQANASGPLDIVPVPRHLLGELYNRADKQPFIKSDYWLGGFVGAGPYKLGEWSRGSTVEALAFDQYFMGRPKVDRIIYHRIPDDNVLYAALLAGSIDMTTMGGFQAMHLVEVKQNWEAQGAGTALAILDGTLDFRFQLRDPAAPWAKDVRVRQALYHMLDRNALAESLQFGLAPPADSIVTTTDPVYPLLEQRGLAKYPYDLVAAQRLFADAGWNRAADGTYRSATGEPFNIDVQFGTAPDNALKAGAVAGQWNAAGVQTSITLITKGATNQDELEHTFTGVQGWPQRDTLDALQSFVSSQVGTAANRWQGPNEGAYVNPTVDRLYAQAIATLDTPARLGLMADILKIEADDVTAMHLFYNVARQTVTFRKGITGPGLVPPNQMVNAWNIERWDISA